MARTYTFQHGDLTITLHVRTGADELAQEVIYAGLVDYADTVPTVRWHQANTYAQIVTQTDSMDGDTDFRLPDVLADVTAHKAAFAALMERTDGVVKAWRKALDSVDSAPVAQAASDPKGAPLTSGKQKYTSANGSPSSTPTRVQEASETVPT